MIFSYKAINSEGKTVSGVYETSEQGQVVAWLKSQRMTPISVSVGKEEGISLPFLERKPKAKDLSMFCEQFCAFLRAGITILDALKMLSNQVKNKTLQKGIAVAMQAVNEGETLGNALGKTPKAFDETLVNLVKAGEASGSLDTSLDRMASQYTKDAEMSAAVKKAMAYPLVVLVVAIGVVVFMLLFVVPAFMKMFADIGIDMPKITLMVVAASEWLTGNWPIVLLILIGVIIAFIMFKRSDTGKKIFSKMALKIPGIKMFTICSHSSRIARTLSTLLAAGMTVIDALQILEQTLSNYYYKEAIRAIREDVINGRPMTDKFREREDLFPPLLTYMIAAGESTGDITSMLVRTAEYYDLEVATATETMMSMLQPAIILLLAGIVGVLVAAVLAPMMTLYTQLGDSL